MTTAMFNDRSTPLSLLATRRSGKARDLVAPGPTPGQLDRLLGVAMRVPDHGKLNPWGLVVIENRDAFAALLEASYRAEVADVDVAPLHAFAHQSPCLVAVISRVVEPHKIPRWEQELSAGAACGLLCAAASAMGFAANWLTGWAAYSPGVAAALGGGRIAGFVFIGTPTQPLEERPRPDPGTVVMHWDG